jgi:predicted acyl esterase
MPRDIEEVRPKPEKPPRKGKIDFQTVMWKECEDGTKLYADIYLPKPEDVPKKGMSIGKPVRSQYVVTGTHIYHSQLS